MKTTHPSSAHDLGAMLDEAQNTLGAVLDKAEAQAATIADLQTALAAAEKRARIAEAALALADALRNRDRKYTAAAPGIDITARVKFVDQGPLVEVKP